MNDLTVIVDYIEIVITRLVRMHIHTYVQTKLHLQYYVSALQCQDKKLRC